MLTELDHLRASVADIQRTRQFYHDDLGLPEICAGETALPAALGGGPSQAAVFQVGPTLVEFFQVPAGAKAGLVQHLGIRSDDLEADRDALSRKGRITFSDEPAPTCAPGLLAALSGRRMAWFQDPYGLNLALTEVREPEAEKGPLGGIDHIKVNCSTFEDGLAFYRDELGAREDRVAMLEGKGDEAETEYVLLSLGRTRLEMTGSGQVAKGESDVLGFLGHMGWLCADPLAYYHELVTRGVTSFSENTKRGPKYNPQGHVFRRYKFDVNDPDQMLVQMVQPLPDVDPDAFLDGENPDMSEPGRARLIRREE